MIFAATIVIWFLQTFDLQLNVAAYPQDSILPALRATSPRCSGRWALRTGAFPPPSSPALWQRRAWCPRCCAVGGPHPGAGGSPAGVLPAVHPLHRGSGLGQAGAGQQVGGHHGGEPVRRGMAVRFAGASGGCGAVRVRQCAPRCSAHIQRKVMEGTARHFRCPFWICQL